MPVRAKRPMILVCLLLIVAVLFGSAWYSKRFVRSAAVSFPPADAATLQLAERLKGHVRVLALKIGERNMWHFERLEQAAYYLEEQLREEGWEVAADSYTLQGRTVSNLQVQLNGGERADEIVLIGAHYDSVFGSPGANDNGSGVAALLELARVLRDGKPQRTLRLVFFVNEEPPFFKTKEMGSRVYARAARKRGERIVTMVSLETIGYFSVRENSQQFPFPPMRLFYPSHGDFVAFVANFRSRSVLQRALGAFRAASSFPAEGLVAPIWLTGVDWSDQWSFWQSGYPALMITDTAPYRYPHYHSVHDTPDKLDYLALARVTKGLEGMVKKLCGMK